MKKRSKLFLRSLAAVSCLAVMLTGCSGATSSSESTAQASTAQEVDTSETIKVRFRIRGSEKPQSNLDVLAAHIKEDLNVDVEFVLVDKNTYDEKLNLMFTSGDIDEIFEMTTSAIINQAVNAGAVEPLDDLIAKDPWNTLDESYFTKLNGHCYALPWTITPPAVFMYRDDWRQNLGLDVPQTSEELYTMLYAFAHDDPDGNGVGDTYGFSMSGEMTLTDPFFTMFTKTSVGSSTGLYLDEESNTIKSALLDIEDMQEALTWLNRAYEEKVLDPEWVVDKDSQVEDKFLTGKTGTYVKANIFILPRYKKAKAANPEAEVAALPSFDGNHGSVYTAPDKASANFYISASAENMDRVKQVYEYFMSAQGQEYYFFGEKGVTYNVVDGQAEWLKEDSETQYNPGQYIAYPFTNGLPFAEPVIDKAIEDTSDVRRLFDTANLTVSIESSTALGDVIKYSREVIAKTIMGEYAVEDYPQYAQEIQAIGLDTILKECNDLYAQMS